jgi:isoamylase
MSGTPLILQPLSCPDARFGSRWVGRRLQFALTARLAKRVSYHFYDGNPLPEPGTCQPCLVTVELHPEQHRSDACWAWETEWPDGAPLPERLTYLIEIEHADGSRHRILDPWTRECWGGERWEQPLAFVQTANGDLQIRVRPHGFRFEGMRRLATVRPEPESRHRPAKPKLPLEQSIVYEAHLRGLTRHASSPVLPAERGTYRGLISVLPQLRKLGVTVIELLPVFEFDECENPRKHPETDQPLVNYWGYSPLLFFAPKTSYAADPRNATAEFQEMVDAVHEAGLEVWLDVVFNHTAELDEEGPSDHFKALDPESWYLHDSGGKLVNHSGCGNTLRSDHALVWRLLRESLEYWAKVMGVDGFRFDLAPILNRDSAGNLRDTPDFFRKLQDDPALVGIKLIAEPWDAGGGYQLGQASQAEWAEWNDCFRDTIRRAVRGDKGQMAGLADALSGSPEVFGRSTQRRCLSVNFLSAHDGLTLHDLVAYSEKHNHANGEDNRDGHTPDFSRNCGIEGATEDTVVLELRQRKLRLFHALLHLAQGTPMLVAGDEFGRTQHGNNNAYCHDSELTWVDWQLVEQNCDLLGFTQKVIAFRKHFAEFLFARNSKWEWHNTENAAADFSEMVRTLVLEVRKDSPSFDQPACLRIHINCYDNPVEFRLPVGAWQRVLSTLPSLSSGESVSGQHSVAGFSLDVLMSA